MSSNSATGKTTAPAQTGLGARFAWHLRRLMTVALAGLLYGTVWVLVVLAGEVWGDGGDGWRRAATGLGLVCAVWWYATESLENRYTGGEMLGLLRRVAIVAVAGFLLLLFTDGSKAVGSVEAGFFALAFVAALAWHMCSLPRRYRNS